jgi:16S rRNA (adenine1518-N6/adenine1519-N6)-dimethyltransferase
MVMTLTQIKELLKTHDAYPKKQFGQNFLFDSNSVKKIVAAAGIEPDDIVVEVGPGVGNLTQELAKTAKDVIAIENDRSMLAILGDLFDSASNVNIIDADILKFDEGELPKDYKVVANLPFYLAAPAIRKFLESANPPESLTLIIQKEVAQRIVATPPQMSLLAVSVQFYAQAKIAAYINRSSFWPSPKVDSAVIKITPQKTGRAKDFVDKFFTVARAGFSHPRKQLANNLAEGLVIDRGIAERLLAANNIDKTRRAETLDMQEWVNLTRSYSS